MDAIRATETTVLVLVNKFVDHPALEQLAVLQVDVICAITDSVFPTVSELAASQQSPVLEANLK